MNDTPDLITDPKQRLMLIVQAIPKLDEKSPSQFTKAGKPTTLILSSLTGLDVSTAERDEVWAAHLEALGLEEATTLPTHDPAPATTSLLWSVKDKNAKNKPRRHSPVAGGPEYLLTATVPVQMPRAHAIKFLSDPAFVVCNERGEHVPNLPAAENVTAGQDRRASLGEDEVVARLSELTPAALLIRCHRVAGGERMTAQAHRSSLELFLLEAKKRPQAVAEEDDPVGEVVPDDSEYDFNLPGKVA